MFLCFLHLLVDFLLPWIDFLLPWNLHILLIFSGHSPLPSSISTSSSFMSPSTILRSTTSTSDKTSTTLLGQSTKRKTKNLFSYSTSKQTYKKNNIISEHLMNLTLRLLFKLQTSSDTVSITPECTKYHTSSHVFIPCQCMST